MYTVKNLTTNEIVDSKESFEEAKKVARSAGHTGVKETFSAAYTPKAAVFNGAIIVYMPRFPMERTPLNSKRR